MRELQPVAEDRGSSQAPGGCVTPWLRHIVRAVTQVVAFHRAGSAHNKGQADELYAGRLRYTVRECAQQGTSS
jgi:hypothetical protein